MRISALVLTSLLLASTASADLIVPQTAAPRILIPVAATAPGAKGTYFRSDMQLINFRSTTQRVQLFWLPQGQNGSAIAPRVLDIGPLSGRTSEDFVDTIMAQSGVGAIEIIGVTDAGVFDPDARLYATARIWTPRPDGGAGTMSQTFPALVEPGSTAAEKTIFGLRRSTDYRLNIGIVNPSQITRRFRVTTRIVGQADPETVVYEADVAPRSIDQRLLQATASGIAQIQIESLTQGATDWQAWGSSVDNASGDAWSEIAFPSAP